MDNPLTLPGQQGGGCQGGERHRATTTLRGVMRRLNSKRTIRLLNNVTLGELVNNQEILTMFPVVQHQHRNQRNARTRAIDGGFARLSDCPRFRLRADRGEGGAKRRVL